MLWQRRRTSWRVLLSSGLAASSAGCCCCCCCKGGKCCRNTERANQHTLASDAEINTATADCAELQSPPASPVVARTEVAYSCVAVVRATWYRCDIGVICVRTDTRPSAARRAILAMSCTQSSEGRNLVQSEWVSECVGFNVPLDT